MNRTSWRSIAGNNFARKMWFARLRASGFYNPSCKRKKGACKNTTKAAASSLKQTKYANMSPKSKKGKVTTLRSDNAIKELLKEGSKKGNSTPQQRAALAKTLRKQGKQRGAKTSINKERVRATTQSGKTTATRLSAVTSVNAKRIADAKKTLAQRQASETIRKSFDAAGRRRANKQSAAIKRRLLGETVTIKKRKKS